jgi:uncharacterized membrane protein SpoIIM required for sporulation
MTPMQFSARYAAEWQELAAALDQIEARRHARGRNKAAPGSSAAPAVDADRLAALYRRSCEHLAIAQARAYPIGMTERLQQLTYRAHRLVYRRQDFGAGRLRQMLLADIPRAVRQHRGYVLLAVLLFLAPTLLLGWTTYRDPGFALHVLSARELNLFRDMYSGDASMVGYVQGAESDWSRFGYYIMHNISLAFQCFAGGLFGGIGSAFFLVYNGVYGGVVAGYLTQYGYATHFYSFVITHSAFELTAICLSGAAGLRMGMAFIAPGRRARLEALKLAAGEAVVLIYAVFIMLVIAAGLEAFWSGAPWIAPPVKFGVGAASWAMVLAYFLWQGGALVAVPAARVWDRHAH